MDPKELITAPIIGGGVDAVIMRLGPDLVAKVGRISPEEAEIQRWAAAEGIGLPVLGWWPDARVPRKLVKRVCPAHGWESGGEPWRGFDCFCQWTEADILLMPLAAPIDAWTPAARRFARTVSRRVDRTWGGLWEGDQRHIAHWHGRFVALDFGLR